MDHCFRTSAFPIPDLLRLNINSSLQLVFITVRQCVCCWYSHFTYIIKFASCFAELFIRKVLP